MSEKNSVNFSIEGSIEDQFPNDKKNKTNGYNWLLIILLFLSLGINVYFLWFNKDKSVIDRNELSKQKGYNEQLDSLNLEMKRLQNQLGILLPQVKTPEGIFFEIQIGAFENFNLDAYEAEMSEMRQEKHDMKNKFLLGRFADLNKALRFENDIKRLGFSGAFMVGRVDGIITTKEEAIKAQKLKE